MELKRVGVWSAGKVCGAIGLLVGLIPGLIFAIASASGAAADAQQKDGDPAIALMMFLGAAAIVIVPLAYGVMGLISGLIYALIYNLIAHFVGGLELELQPLQSQR